MADLLHASIEVVLLPGPAEEKGLGQADVGVELFGFELEVEAAQTRLLLPVVDLGLEVLGAHGDARTGGFLVALSDEEREEQGIVEKEGTFISWYSALRRSLLSWRIIFASSSLEGGEGESGVEEEMLEEVEEESAASTPWKERERLLEGAERSD